MPVIKAGTAKTREGDAGSPLGAHRAQLISDTGHLTQFGALIEELPPGSRSSHPHWHQEEDEMVLLLSGTLILIENGSETELQPGDAACWPAGQAVAHSMENRGDAPARYVVIGTRVPRDTITYPDHDRILTYDRAAGTRSYHTRDGRPASKPT